MDRCCLEYTSKKIIPEAFDLHVLAADQAQIHQHIQTYQKLYDASGILVLPDKQKDSQGNGASDVTEVKQIEDIIFGKP